jgi:hypothetical protein
MVACGASTTRFGRFLASRLVMDGASFRIFSASLRIFSACGRE